jgi:hypothetical protein
VEEFGPIGKREDPCWRAWWDAMPREDLRLIAETVKRFLDSSGDRSVIGDRESLIAVGFFPLLTDYPA